MRQNLASSSSVSRNNHYYASQFDKTNHTFQATAKEAECPYPLTHKRSKILFNYPQTGMLSGIPESAICVQRFDDSQNSAIHTTYRNSLRSSSMREPRD